MLQWTVISMVLLSLANTATAQEGNDEWGDDELGYDEGDGFEDESFEDDDSGPGEAEDDDEAPSNEKEPGWFAGAYLRAVWVPSFMQELFLDAAPNAANVAFGAALTKRAESGFSLIIGIGFTSYGFEGPYRAKGDPDEDTEWVESDLGLVHVTGSMLWAEEFSDRVALEYGFGVDLGIVTGEMVRTEAFPAATDDGYAKCGGPGSLPNTYCGFMSVPYDQEGEHYNAVEERVPPVALLPMIPHLALRIAPTPKLALKVEASYGIIQLWIGASAAYGFDI